MHILECRNIKKSFGRCTAVNDVSFCLKRGSITGFLGPNGAGKTTLIKIISGVLIQDEGDVFIEGALKKRGATSPHIGVIFEGEHNIYGYMTAIDNIRYFSLLNGTQPNTLHNRELEILFEVLELNDYKHKYCYDLSRGMRQKLLIIIALIKNPSIFIMDEPTLGLDIIAAKALKEWLVSYSNKYEKTVLVTSHDMSFVNDVCKDILLVNEGEIRWHGDIESFRSLAKVQPSYKIVISYSEDVCTYLRKSNACFNKKGDVIEIEACGLSVLKDLSEHSEILEVRKNDDVSESFFRIVNE